MNTNSQERRSYDTSIKEISSKLSSLDSKITNVEVDSKLMFAKLENLHISNHTAHQQIQVLLDKHDKTIYGNGSPGLVALRDQISSAIKSFESRTVQERWIHGLIISTQISIIIMLVNLIFKR